MSENRGGYEYYGCFDWDRVQEDMTGTLMILRNQGVPIETIQRFSLMVWEDFIKALRKKDGCILRAIVKEIFICDRGTEVLGKHLSQLGVPEEKFLNSMIQVIGATRVIGMEGHSNG